MVHQSFSVIFNNHWGISSFPNEFSHVKPLVAWHDLSDAGALLSIFLGAEETCWKFHRLGLQRGETQLNMIENDHQDFMNGGNPKSSILIGFSLINHPFWDTPSMETTTWIKAWDPPIFGMPRHSQKDQAVRCASQAIFSKSQAQVLHGPDGLPLEACFHVFSIDSPIIMMGFSRKLQWSQGSQPFFSSDRWDFARFCRFRQWMCFFVRRRGAKAAF